MRQMSPSMIKGKSKVSDGIPQPGTKIRFVYDFFYENRGKLIPREELLALADLVASGTPTRERGQALSSIVNTLRNYWGCDIRCERRTRVSYHFVGEWCGRVYVDYTVEASERAA